MKLLFGRKPIAEAGSTTARSVPDFERALRDGLAGVGDRRILDYATSHEFILVSTDSHFEGLLIYVPGAKVVILRSCNAIRIAELPNSQDHLIILDQ
jgi:predicted nuclease of predicted toxin-antitoxin system